MKISWALLEKGPGVKEFVDWLLGLSVFMCVSLFPRFSLDLD